MDSSDYSWQASWTADTLLFVAYRKKQYDISSSSPEEQWDSQRTDTPPNSVVKSLRTMLATSGVLTRSTSSNLPAYTQPSFSNYKCMPVKQTACTFSRHVVSCLWRTNLRRMQVTILCSIFRTDICPGRYKNGHEIDCTLRSEYGYTAYEIRSFMTMMIHIVTPYTIVEGCNEVPVNTTDPQLYWSTRYIGPCPRHEDT